MNRFSSAFHSPACPVSAARPVRDTCHFRLILLGAGIILYGLAGSPTPDSLSPALVVCALLLVAALPLGSRMPVLWPGQAMPLSHDAGLIFLYYGLSVPLLTGLFSGHADYEIMRDMIWLGMMGLPLFYVYNLGSDRRSLVCLLSLMAVAGWLFAARVVLTGWIAPLSLLDNDPVLYLPNSPLVMFAALWLGGTGMSRITYADRVRPLVAGMVLTALAFVPVAAMMSMLQRASFAVLLLGIVLFVVIVFVRAPARLWRVAGVLAVVAMLLGPFVLHIYDLLWTKTQAVGANMRPAEAWTVLQHVAATPLTALFGHGWGAMYVSPAVGDVPVGFTHSLITYLWLKTGLIGLALGGIYISALLARSLARAGQWPVLTYSLCMPVLVHVVLYANHKSFGFAMLLVGCAQAGFSCRRGDDNRVGS